MLDVGTGLSEAENRKLLADWRVRFELTRSRRGVRQLRVRGNREFRRRFIHFHGKAHTFGDETYAILAKGAASGLGRGAAHAAREGVGRGTVVGVLVLGSYEFHQDFVSDEKSLAEALGGVGAMAVGTAVGNAVGAAAYAGAASVWLTYGGAIAAGGVFFGGVVIAAAVSFGVGWALDRYGATGAVETRLTEKLDRAGWGDVDVTDLKERMTAIGGEIETLIQ